MTNSKAYVRLRRVIAGTTQPTFTVATLPVAHKRTLKGRSAQAAAASASTRAWILRRWSLARAAGILSDPAASLGALRRTRPLLRRRRPQHKATRAASPIDASHAECLIDPCWRYVPTTRGCQSNRNSPRIEMNGVAIQLITFIHSRIPCLSPQLPDDTVWYSSTLCCELENLENSSLFY